MNGSNADIRAQFDIAFESALSALDQQRVLQRVLDKDPSLWTEIGIDEAEAAHLSDWVDAFERTKRKLDRLNLRPGKTIALVGMGGASLAAEVFSSIFSQKTGCLLETLSSTSPHALKPHLSQFAPKKDLYLFSSKSGSTVETLDIARTLFDAIDLEQSQLAVITDPEQSELRKWAHDKSIQTIASDPNVAGRYSALSTLGLVPASALGVDVDALHENYTAFKSALCAGSTEKLQNARRLASMLATLCELPGGAVIISVGKPLKPLAHWIEQLVSESLGKYGKGVLPIIDCAPDAAWPDLAMEVAASFGGAEPWVVVCDSLFDDHDLARVFYQWELAVAAAGFLCAVNPIDQPDVEGNKRSVSKALQALSLSDSATGAGVANYSIRCTGGMSEAAVLDLVASLRSSIRKTQYLAVLAYIDPGPESERDLARFAMALESRIAGNAVYGFGPQYLHSTGQLHKGGPASGHYLIITADAEYDFEVKGKPYRFGDLCALQADTDSEALSATGRPVYRIHLDEPIAKRLNWLSAVCGSDAN